jgi:hypothetical protein
MMSRTLYLINFVLVVLVIFLASKDYEEWTQTKVGGAEGIVSKAKAGAAPAPAPSNNEVLDPKRYKSISEKNLFSPDRKEFPVPLGPGEAKKPLARPNVTLYGIVISDELSSAVISNLGRRTEKNERDTISVKIGDKVGEYRVAKILGDRINLEAEGDSFDVLLYDPSRPKSRPVVAPPPAKPSPTPATPPRPFTPPIPGVGQSSASPPAGIGQAPLLPPSGREVPRASTLRQRRDLRRPTVQPPARTPVVPSADDDDEDEDED